MWLEQRLAEGRSLVSIVAALQAAEEGQAVRGAGVAGRASQPTETSREHQKRRVSSERRAEVLGARPRRPSTPPRPSAPRSHCAS